MAPHQIYTPMLTSWALENFFTIIFLIIIYIYFFFIEIAPVSEVSEPHDMEASENKKIIISAY